jgi:hypothetical protein
MPTPSMPVPVTALYAGLLALLIVGGAIVIRQSAGRIS